MARQLDNEWRTEKTTGHPSPGWMRGRGRAIRRALARQHLNPSLPHLGCRY